MGQIFIKYIYEFFKKLIEVHGFKIKAEINDGQSYMIEYCSESFVIHIEKYFREFYVSLYKVDDPDNGIDLFNLLEYLKRETTVVPTSEYFRKEKDIEECYRKQLQHISIVIYENFDVINDYFSDGNYEARFADMRNFRKNKYPELYKKA
jgi:hypothetical protein